VRLRVTWFGRRSASAYEKQVETYRQRVDRRWPSEDCPLRPVSGGRERDPRRVLRLEAEAVERHREPGWLLVALDERGRVRDSEDFARWLAGLEDRGVGGILFVIGSDLGLDHTLLEHADERISLSAMTLPHLLARALLWEQLYRATSILGGGGYHRSCVQ
jgi:23S rRNA (pseudouridine1915-N3)-methyltransferase